MPQDFLDISNPKAVLEMTLRGFSCLTRGDCICLHYNNKKYYIDIIEAKPQVDMPSASPLGSYVRMHNLPGRFIRAIGASAVCNTRRRP